MRGFVSITVWLLTASMSCALPNEPPQRRTEAFFPFARDGSLTVENTDGSIHFYSWKEPRVRLVALRKAYTAARLQEIRVETNARPASIVVHTRIPVAAGLFADRSGTVDYTLTVPETARLEKLSLVNGEITLQGLRGGSANAEIVNGRITALNCFAQVHGRVTNGAMEAFFDWWEDIPARVDYVITHGMIRVKLPREARFAVDAATAGGNLTNQFGLLEKRKGEAGKTLRGATATHPPMSLFFQSSEGNVSIDLTR